MEVSLLTGSVWNGYLRESTLHMYMFQLFGYKRKYSGIVFSMPCFWFVFCCPVVFAHLRGTFPTPLVPTSVLPAPPVCGLSASTTTMVSKLGWMKQVIEPITFYGWELVPSPFTESVWSVWWGGFSLAQQISWDYWSVVVCVCVCSLQGVGKWGIFLFLSYCWRLLCWTLGSNKL